MVRTERRLCTLGTMGFKAQPNLWQCGPYALKHALIILGVFADEKEISKIAGAQPRAGADERQLRRAARRYGCGLPTIRHRDAADARRALGTHLRRGHPVLLCVDQWDHWVTAVKTERGKFILLDSAEPPVLTILPWARLCRWWGYRTDGETWYDLHPVLPEFRVRTHPQFSIQRARFLQRPSNRALSRDWERYVGELLRVAKPRTPLSEDVLSMGEFLRRNRNILVDQVRARRPDLERRRSIKILHNLRFVADTHGLVIHTVDEKRMVAGMATLLALEAGR